MANFIYIGTENVERLLTYLEQLNNPDSIDLSVLCSLDAYGHSPISRPDNIPKSAERMGEYFVDRYEYHCVPLHGTYYWFQVSFSPLQRQYYWDYVFTRPCLTIKETEALLAVPYKLLNTKAQWMRSFLVREKRLTQIFVDASLTCYKALKN